MSNKKPARPARSLSRRDAHEPARTPSEPSDSALSAAKQQEVIGSSNCLTNDESTEALEGIDQGFVDLDANWRITYINENAEHIYRVKRQDLLGKNFWDVFARTRGTIFEQEYRRTMESRIPARIEAYDPALKNWVRVSSLPRMSGGLALYLNQVTRQRRAQMLAVGQKLAFELAASGASLPEVLKVLAATAETNSDDCIGTAIFLTSMEGPVLRFVEVVSVPESLARGVEEVSAIGPQSHSCGRAAYSGRTVTESDIELEPLWAPYLPLARELKIRACWSQPIRSTNDKILGAITIYHRKPALAEPSDVDFLRLLAYTAAVLIERYKAEQELANVNKELCRANADLKQFAYSAGHDLQEPLRSVKVYSELLMRRYQGAFDGQALEFLDHVRNGAAQMQTLLQDLLSFLQVTHLDVPTEEVDAGEALNAALANLQAGIAETGAQVTSDALPSLRVHRIHLQQLFQNLISNAIKYRGQGRPIVHIGLQRLQSEWRFSVRDNGIGIDPEYKERIFGLFKRLHAKDEYSGTGIGLALCKRIVDQYHGRIWVESEPGQGSEFYVAFPA